MYDFHGKMCNSNTFFHCLCSALMERMVFIVLLSLETVHDTVQYGYCSFPFINPLLRIRLKRQNPLLSYVREREREREKKYIANAQCRVQYTLLLPYLMLIMSYCA